MRSVFALENFSVRVVNPPRRQRNWLLKGTGDETLIDLSMNAMRFRPFLARKLKIKIQSHNLFFFHLEGL